MKGLLNGTTFTGHPTRTTFGNTLRMLFYTRFILSKCSSRLAIALHAGDDVLAYLNRSLALQF